VRQHLNQTFKTKVSVSSIGTFFYLKYPNINGI
jgi:hypothetical protein